MSIFKFSVGGSRYRTTYSASSINPLHVEPTGKIDQFAEIQAYKDSVLLENLINKAVNGDPDALNQAQGMYGTFDELPDDYHELFNAYHRGMDLYDKLPESVKEVYPNIESILEDFAAGVMPMFAQDEEGVINDEKSE